MNTTTSHASDRRRRLLRYARHPLVIFAVVEAVLLAGTVFLVLTRK